jgi:SAM-dependent methyltransferase
MIPVASDVRFMPAASYRLPAVSDEPRDHWPRHVRRWALVGPPLRPCAEDVAIQEQVAASAGAALRSAVVLGVTPELVAMRWPARTRVLAVERSRDVIGALFPGGEHAGAVQADWRALPVEDRSIDLVVGDGSLSNLRFPGDYEVLADELARVLRPGGRVALRLFAAPAEPESLAEVAAALHAGRIGSFHALKWRLAMAAQPGEHNLPVTDILRAFDEVVPDRAALAAATGWPTDVIASIDVYRGSALVYSFPTRGEVRAALAPALELEHFHQPSYELGDRCPTVVLSRGAVPWR